MNRQFLHTQLLARKLGNYLINRFLKRTQRKPADFQKFVKLFVVLN